MALRIRLKALAAVLELPLGPSGLRLGVRAHARKRLVYLGDLVRPAALDVVEIDPFLAERTLSVYQRAPVVLDEVVENAAVRIHHQPRFPLVAVLDVDDDAGRGLGSLSVIHTMPRAARPEIPAPGTATRYAICHTPMLGTLLVPVL